MNPRKARQQKQAQTLLHGRTLARLIGDWLRGEPPQEVPDDASWEDIYELAHRHGTSALAYRALDGLKQPPNPELQARWKERYERAILRDLILTVARDRLYEALQQQSLDYIPLKGINLRELYPSPALREMTDQDLLVRKEQQEDLRMLMKTLGYRLLARHSHHDTYYKPPGIYIEAHHQLLPKGSPHQTTFADVWQRAEGGRLSPLDEVLYHTAHLHRHWTEAGTGLRSLTDLLCLGPRKELQPQLDRELEQMGLLSFHRSMTNLAVAVLEDRPLDPQQEEQFLFLLEAGTYGTPATAAYQGVMQERRKGRTLASAKFRYLLSRLFPDPEALNARFHPQEQERGGYPLQLLLLRLLKAGRTLPRHLQELSALAAMGKESESAADKLKDMKNQ